MFHKVKSVNALPDFVLSVQFSEGITKTYDVKMLFERWPAFEKLKAESGYFDKVQVDQGGYGIIWDDYLDLSCDELFENGTVVKTPFDRLMAFSDATELWCLKESTLRKAISCAKLKNGIDDCKFGKQWVISMDAMLREYGEPKKEI